MKRLTFGVLAIFSLLTTVNGSASDLKTNTIVCENLSEFHRLWEDAAFGRDPSRTERAAWILQSSGGKYQMLRWPHSAAWSKEQWRGAAPNSIVAQVHTHPVNASERPSSGDVRLANQIGTTIYVISAQGIWSVTSDGKISKEQGPRWFKELSNQCN